MVADIAPGLQRQRWGFEKLPAHDARCWEALLADANSRAERGRARQLPEILGYDADASTLSRAQANIQRAGLAKVVRVTQKPLAELRKPTHLQLDRGLVIVNPPYGERLGEKESLRYLYRELGNVLSREFEGWQGAIFTSDKELGLATRLRSHKRYALYNGTLPSQLLLFNLGTESRRPPLPEGAAAGLSAQDANSSELGENAQMFANRLRKNQRRLDKWLRREGISCYRLYDADMPEYAVAVDRYGDFLHVAEYRAPAGIDPADAQRRLQEVVSALPVATGVAPERIFYKERQRQRGTQQYQKEAAEGELHTVHEGRVKLLVNFSDYLDTGLFLDHRPLRQRLAAESRGKDFLNLFCYTAAASVHACAGGARSTTSVARKNLALNGYAENSNTLVQADCLLWMTEQEAQYDLILLDPPSFSNSRRMQQTLDIQRDQVQLLRAAMALLRPQGVLYFSNNLRSFALADEVAEFCAVENITRQTLDPDYQRGRSGHQCWKLQHLGWPRVAERSSQQ
jgi:23S rRNA (guanine2445-N2)-methyltransferase / 23S rRNA (guanine2069-N7)-methyltransferase